MALAASCGSGTEPDPQIPIDLVLDFCSSDIPVWIAYRNEGEDWTRLTPNAEGTISFTASNDVMLAFVRQSGGDYDTEFVQAANFELEDISGLACREEAGIRTIHGTVSGVVGSQVSLIGMSYSSVYLPSTSTSFSLGNLPDRPLDVIGARVNIVGATQAADRIIIRRSQNLLNGANMPVMNFAGTEALQPTAFGLTLSGIGASEHAFLSNYFVSQLETSLLLSYSEPVANGSHTAYGVPTAQLAQGDYHTAFAVVVDPNGQTRGSQRYFRAPGAQTLPVSPEMSAPDVQQAGTAPDLRFRAIVPRDAEYGQAMTAGYLQESNFTSTRVTITTTGNFNGGGSWDATIPDMSGASGWQNAWGLSASGEPVDWTITVYGGNPGLLFGAAPADGELIRFASFLGSMVQSRLSWSVASEESVAQPHRPVDCATVPLFCSLETDQLNRYPGPVLRRRFFAPRR